MFSKQYEVDEAHIDFQGVVDGLYYPFYMEWARHAYMREALRIDIEAEFTQGNLYMVLEYSMRFRKSLKKGDQVEVTCVLERNENVIALTSFSRSKLKASFSPTPLLLPPA